MRKKLSLFFQVKHTTNLKNHLATKHSKEFQIVDDLNSKRVSSNKSMANEINPKIEDLKKLCVRLVTVHGRLLSMMEDEAFQSIINIAAATEFASKNMNVKAIKSQIHEEALRSNQKLLLK